MNECALEDIVCQVRRGGLDCGGADHSLLGG